jgi:anti-anti-sigma factor
MTSDEMVRWTTTGTFPVAHLAGEIDTANASPCFDAVTAHLDGAAVVVVDLSAVTFIDSMCLAQLVKLARTQAVRLVAPPGQPRQVLEITALDKVFDLFDTVSAAQELQQDA